MRWNEFGGCYSGGRTTNPIERNLFSEKIPNHLITEGLPSADACLFENGTLYIATETTIREIKGCDQSRTIAENAPLPITDILCKSNDALYFSSLSGRNIFIYRVKDKAVKEVMHIAKEHLITYKIKDDCLYVAYQNGIQTINLITHEVETCEIKERIFDAKISPPHFFLCQFNHFRIATADYNVNNFFSYETTAHLAISSHEQFMTFARYNNMSGELIFFTHEEGHTLSNEYRMTEQVQVDKPQIIGTEYDLFFSLSKTKLLHVSTIWDNCSYIDLDTPLDLTKPFQIAQNHFFFFPLESPPDEFRCFVYQTSPKNQCTITIPSPSPFQKAHLFGNKFILSSPTESILWDAERTTRFPYETFVALQQLKKENPWNSTLHKLIQQLDERT